MYTENKLSKKDLLNKLKHIKLLSVDADGTLTDGKVTLHNDGMQERHFYAHDGVGLGMIQATGVKIVLLTSSHEPVLERRSEILKCDHFISGTLEKYKKLKELADSLGIDLEHTVHIGDDLNDLSALLKVGIPITVNNASPVVKDMSAYVTQKDSKHGAVREVCDLIMLAKTGYPFGAPYVVGEDYQRLCEFYDRNGYFHDLYQSN